MTIRHAEPEEAARLTEIAIAAKRYWGYPESWLEAWRAGLTITSEFIVRHEVFVAIEDDQPVGFYTLVISEVSTELDHLWVLPEWIGKGIGRRLLNHALDRASAIGARQIEIVSDPNAEGFYRKAGANQIGEFVSTIEGQERKLPRLALEVLDIFEIGDMPK